MTETAWEQKLKFLDQLAVQLRERGVKDAFVENTGGNVMCLIYGVDSSCEFSARSGRSPRYRAYWGDADVNWGAGGMILGADQDWEDPLEGWALDSGLDATDYSPQRVDDLANFILAADHSGMAAVMREQERSLNRTYPEVEQGLSR